MIRKQSYWQRRSPAIYPALMLALHTGLRDAEILGLQWGRLDLLKAVVTVGDSKTEAGQGRKDHPTQFGRAERASRSFQMVPEEVRHDASGDLRVPIRQASADRRHAANDLTQNVMGKGEERRGCNGRWHDNRHTFITNLAESGEAGDETIRDTAGHVSKQMLKHYSHIGQQAKRRAVYALVKKPAAVVPDAVQTTWAKNRAKSRFCTNGAIL